MKRIAVIGAGAAGCFCAIEMKRRMPDATIEILEAKNRPLAKVAITGGGRCNLTNTFRRVDDLRRIYPRGDKLMRRMLADFSHKDAWNWFENEGVKLVAQEDECVFPVSQDAMEIVNTLTGRLRDLKVPIRLGHRIKRITPAEEAYELTFETQKPQFFDAVVVTTGGSPKMDGLTMFDALDLKISEPLPSLFTLCIAGDWMQGLMGAVVEETSVALAGTKIRAEGPLLITHWGMSGPAVLKLTSYAARELAQKGYEGQIVVNWLGNAAQDDAARYLREMIANCGDRNVVNEYPRQLTNKLWRHLLSRAHVRPETKWKDLGKKAVNCLVNALVADCYDITGKFPHKEEFVTCGGIALTNVDSKTLMCKKHPGLFFAGEILDVDAITGGFNLQAAWSMGWCVAKSVVEFMNNP